MRTLSFIAAVLVLSVSCLASVVEPPCPEYLPNITIGDRVQAFYHPQVNRISLISKKGLYSVDPETASIEEMDGEIEDGRVLQAAFHPTTGVYTVLIERDGTRYIKFPKGSSEYVCLDCERFDYVTDSQGNVHTFVYSQRSDGWSRIGAFLFEGDHYVDWMSWSQKPAKALGVQVSPDGRFFVQHLGGSQFQVWDSQQSRAVSISLPVKARVIGSGFKNKKVTEFNWLGFANFMGNALFVAQHSHATFVASSPFGPFRKESVWDRNSRWVSYHNQNYFHSQDNATVILPTGALLKFPLTSSHRISTNGHIILVRHLSSGNRYVLNMQGEKIWESPDKIIWSSPQLRYFATVKGVFEIVENRSVIKVSDSTGEVTKDNGQSLVWSPDDSLFYSPQQQSALTVWRRDPQFGILEQVRVLDEIRTDEQIFLTRNGVLVRVRVTGEIFIHGIPRRTVVLGTIPETGTLPEKKKK